MIQASNYAQTLRAIGQDLEGKHPKNFDLEVSGDLYFVRAKVGVPSSAETFEWRYTSEDIERLEREGKARRSDSGGMPDFLSLSQILRGVGCYVDLKGGYIQRTSKEDQVVTIEYTTGLSQHNRAVCPVSTLYDLCVRMYIQRSSRSGSMDVEETG